MAAPRREDEEYTFDKFDDGSNSKNIANFLNCGINLAEKRLPCFYHQWIFLTSVTRNGGGKSDDQAPKVC